MAEYEIKNGIGVIPEGKKSTMMDTKEMPTLIEVTLKPFKSFKELGKGEFTADTTFIFCGYRYDEPNTFILWDNNLLMYMRNGKSEYKNKTQRLLPICSYKHSMQ